MLRAVLRTSAEAARDPERWLGPRLDALADGRAPRSRTQLRLPRPRAAPPPLATRRAAPRPQQLLAQVRRIEQSLVPVVGAAVEQRAGDTLLANKVVQIIELLDARLGAR